MVIHVPAIFRAILALSFLVLTPIAGYAAEEQILSLKSDIIVVESATPTVVETIIVRATGDKIKHGI